MKITLILLCLQISISQARPFGDQEISKDIYFSEDPWDFKPKTHKNKLAGGGQEGSFLDINHENPGNEMFVGATSSKSDSKNFWINSASDLLSLKNNGAQNSENEIKEVLDKLIKNAKNDKKGKNIWNNEAEIGARLKSAHKDFLKAKEQHAERFANCLGPVLEHVMRNFVESIPDMVEILMRAIIEGLASGGGHSHHPPPPKPF